MMDVYDIPAEPLSISEEIIKKSRFITMLAHTEGVEAARAFVQQVKAEHPTAITAGHTWRDAPMIPNSWDFLMTVNHPARQASRCWRS